MPDNEDNRGFAPADVLTMADQQSLVCLKQCSELMEFTDKIIRRSKLAVADSKRLIRESDAIMQHIKDQRPER